MLKLLLVEDEPVLVKMLRLGLTAEGYTVVTARDGLEGERLALSESPDLLIVDWMLPRQDGRTLVQKLREADVAAPVLMLTAFTEPERTVAALDAGADDYLSKPFSFDELFARLRALARRRTPRSTLEVGTLRMDTQETSVHLDGQPLDLRPKEFLLLRLLLRHAGDVVDRTTLAERIWGTTYTSDDAINMTVSSLRRKLRDGAGESSSVQIETVRGVGYRLNGRSPEPEADA